MAILSITHDGAIPDSPSDPLSRKLAAAIFEAKRLADYPGLFPSCPGTGQSSDNVRRRFELVMQTGMRRFESRAAHHARLKQKHEYIKGLNALARKEDAALQRLNQPTYLDDLLPWEQFLLRDSPGCGIKLPDAPPNVAYQMVPFGGALLLNAWLKENAEMEEKIKSSAIPNLADYQTLREKVVGIDQAEQGSTQPRTSSNRTTTTSTAHAGTGGNTQQQQPQTQRPQLPSALGSGPAAPAVTTEVSLHQLPNLYRRRHGPQIRDNLVTDQLENFNEVIENLEGRGQWVDHNMSSTTRILIYRSTNSSMHVPTQMNLDPDA